MKKINFYESLPETVSQVRVESELSELLENVESYNSSLFLDCLYELSVRQVLNYCLIDVQLRERLNIEVINRWDSSSVNNTQICLSIIINLGLQGAYDEILRQKASIETVEVKNEIQEVLQEVGPSVENVDDIG
ncbi:hypothetical protein [Rheinheimera gaetbuli]